jgi:hypothetical protein
MSGPCMRSAPSVACSRRSITFVWCNHAPSKVRFFAWLLSKARIQSRSSLLHKRILTTAEAVCPVCAGEEETASHIIFGCEFAARFWRSLGFSFPHNVSVTMLHTYAAPAGIPAEKASPCRFRSTATRLPFRRCASVCIC